MSKARSLISDVKCQMFIVKCLAFAGFLFATIFPTANANAAWLSGWSNRRAVTIDNTAGSALTNYQVSVDTTNAIYNENGLVGSWHFNEGSGTMANDSSGNANIGILTKGATMVPIQWVAGKNGSGLSFSGNNYVNVFNNEKLNITGALTVSIWINPTVSGSSAYRTILAKRSAAGSNYELYLKNDAGANAGRLSWFTGTEIPSSYIPPVGQWTHVAATISGTSLKIYANGVEVLSSAIAAVGANAGMLAFGRAGDYDSEYFIGSMDEARVYSRALSPSEIYDLYTASKARLDYGDVRFTDSDGSTPINYWRENDKKYWVEVPSISAASQKTIYMYYGNSLAVSDTIGGTMSISGGYVYQTFKTSGVFIPPVNGTIDVYAWGGGGGGGTPGGWVYGAAGGAGGAARGTMSVTAGAVYPIVVGGGGGVNSYAAGALTCVDGGGACASWNNSDNRYGSGGGGYSGIFASSITQANARLIAGGGGGGGSSRAGTGNVGGAGGGSVGENGTSPYDGKTAYRGLGGTQSAAGADASCDSANTTGGQGALQGGRSRINSYGGAGGGGYWGGSGGGYSESNTMGGGGGGSSYYNPTYVSSAVLTGGTGTTPGDSANALRGTAGAAGAVSTAGTSGIVVIKYLASSDLGLALASVSSGEDTFEFFDDFSGSSINSSKWNVIGAPNTVPLTGVVSNWKFNETSGTTATDSTSAYNGTFVSSPTWTSGMIGNGLSFDSGDYVSVPYNAALNITGNLTIAMWIKPNAIACSGSDPGFTLLAHRTSNTSTPYLFDLGCGGSLTLNYWATVGYTYPTFVTSPGIISTGTWQHVAVTRSLSGNDATVSFYLNGQFVSSSMQTTGVAQGNTQGLWISRDAYRAQYTIQGTYSGLMDEVQIYNRALSSTEISQVFGTSPVFAPNGAELKGSNTTDRMTSIYTFNSGVIQETKSRYSTLPTNGFMEAGFYGGVGNYFGYLQHPGTNYYENSGAVTALAGTVPPASTSYLTKIAVKSASAVDFITTNYSTGLPYQSVSDVSNVVSAEPIVFGRRYDGDTWNGQAYEAYWDWVRVRKYTAIEPITSVYGEQNNLTFTKRRAITIDNTTNASTLYDYQIPIDITEATYNNHGLIGSWHLNDGSGNGVIDSSGENNNGTWTGTGTYWAKDATRGVVGNFNGSDNGLSIGTGFTYQTFTISLWVKPGATQQTYADLFDNNHTGAQNFVFQQNVSTLNQYTFGTLNASASCTTGVFNLTTSTWQYVTAVRDVSSVSVYINGVLASSSAANCTLPITYSAQNFYFGKHATNIRYWNGQMDEIRAYDRALSSSEILDLYNATKSKLDYSDIRFSDSTSYNDQSWSLGYSYWLESDKKAWIKIPSLAANTQKTIYMYYGNSSATSQSNGDNTFNFFDDFSGDLSRWTVRAGMSLVNGELDVPSNATSDTTPTFSNAYFGTSYIYDAKIKAVSGTRLQPIPVYLSDGGGGSTMVRYISDLGASNMYESHTWGVNTSLGYNGGVNNNLWHTWTMIRKPASVTLKSDNLQIGGETGILAGYNVTSRIGISAYNTAAKYDDVRIRKYSATEPTASVYGEQNNLTFLKRRAITIDNTTNASTLYDYQIPVDLTTALYKNEGLVGSWHFNEGAGISANDSSGNNNYGTLVGGPIWADGKYGSSLTFNGSNNYVSSASAINVGNRFAIEFWMKPTGLHNYGDPVSFGSADFRITFVTYADGSMDFAVGNSSNAWGNYIHTAAGTFVNGTWYHIVGTANGTNIELFVNGISKGTAVNSNSVNDIVNIGRKASSGYYFTGLVDEVRIYNRPISISEISDHYNGIVAKIDYSDIRFTDDTNYSDQNWTHSYPYWLESDKKAWIKIPSLAANTQKTIYMYYGNSSATSQSNGINTFNYWDDGSTTDGWRGTASAGKDITLGNGIPSYKAPASNYIYKNIGLTPNRIIEYDTRTSGLGHFDFLINAAGQGQGFDFDTRNLAAPDKSNWYITSGFAAWTVSTNTGLVPTANTWYRMKLTLDSSTAAAAYSTDNGLSFTPLAATFAFTNYGGGINLSGDGVGQTNWDNIRIRKYIATEPTTSLYNEQSNNSFVNKRAITIINSSNPSTIYDYQVPVDLTSAIYDNTGLIGSWHFNEGAGTLALDSSESYNNGILTNSPIWTVGKYNSGLNFAGTTKVQMASPILSGTGNFTIEAWIYPTVSGGTDYIAGNYGTANTGGIEFYKYTGNLISVYIGGSVTSNTAVNLNDWNHVVVTRNSGSINLYLNGNSVGTGSLAGSIGSAANFTIGNGPDYTSEAFDGKIDEVRVYSRAISAIEVADHYSATKARLDYSDIRFTDDAINYSDRSWTHSYSYWLESDKKAWVKVPSLTASTDKTIYMYHGVNTSGFSATGGTISYSGGYTIHTFNGSGTFTPNGAGTVEVLVVGGGGGGGGNHGGGGGAGGVVYHPSKTVTAQGYTVTVGAGGNPMNFGTLGTNGGNSVFGDITANGGGRSGSYTAATGAVIGGSGGGGPAYPGLTAGAAANQGDIGGGTGYGFAGGNGTVPGADWTGGGGGGAGEIGSSAAADNSKGGDGGDGLAFSISGSSVYYGGGGGGCGNYSSGTVGYGGLGGGGNGANNNGVGSVGAANTGGGGGGARNAAGGAGGSGIVIVRYPTPSSLGITDQSDGNNTFLLFDNFDSYNPINWSSSGTPTISNSTITVPSSIYLYSKKYFPTNTSISWRASASSGVYSSIGFGLNGNSNIEGFYTNYTTGGVHNAVNRTPTNEIYSNMGAQTGYKNLTVKRNSTTDARFTINGGAETTLSTYLNTSPLSAYIFAQSQNVLADWVFVRKYTVTEVIPTISPLSVDCGFRAYDGSTIIVLGCDPVEMLTSPFKISKGGSTYGVKLVDTNDPDASKIRIQTSAGTKSVLKLSSYSSGLTGWTYKKVVTITENSGSTLTNFPVAITTDTASLISAGKMKSDCSDIRFTDTDQSTLLDYFVESGCNTGSTKVWVDVPSITASSQKIVNLHYGNPSATSVASADNTFDVVSYASLATYMNAYNEFWFYMSGSSVYFLKVKENGTQFVPGQDAKYTWTKLSATAHWDNPAGPSWSRSEPGWDDYGTNVWNYWAPGDCYNCYYHILEFVGNGRSGYYSYGSNYHADFVDITGVVTFYGNEGGSSSLIGPLVTYRIKHVATDPTYVLGAEQ